MKNNVKSIILIILAVLFIFPVVAILIASFSIYDGKGNLNFNNLSLKGYKELLFNCFIFYKMFWNSVFYSIVIVGFEIIVIIPCAFAFCFSKIKGKHLLLIFYIILMMMPLQVTILPNYIGLRDLNLLNTRIGIILPMIFSPFGTIVMYQYMKNIDTQVVDALRLETNSIIRIIYTGIMPQIKICIFAVIIFLCAESWNMVEQPTLFLESNNLKPLSVFGNISKSFNPLVQFPCSVISIIPVLLLYFFYHDNLEKGLNFSDLR